MNKNKKWILNFGIITITTIPIITTIACNKNGDLNKAIADQVKLHVKPTIKLQSINKAGYSLTVNDFDLPKSKNENIIFKIINISKKENTDGKTITLTIEVSYKDKPNIENKTYQVDVDGKSYDECITKWKHDFPQLASKINENRHFLVAFLISHKEGGTLIITGANLIPENFYIPEGVVELEDKAIRVSVIDPQVLPNTFSLPNTLQKIGSFAFTGTILPIGFKIPSSVHDININAFYSTKLPANSHWIKTDPNGKPIAGSEVVIN